MTLRIALPVVGIASFLLVAPRAAHACSVPERPDALAIPRTGTQGVSTATSIVVLSSSEPRDLVLTADGAPVETDGAVRVGAGDDGKYRSVDFWRVRLPGDGMLQPSTTYELSAEVWADGGTGRSVLTSFTTGPRYDKEPGTPAAPKSLRLWRVRYPLGEIGSGNCVFSEYVGFISIDWDPASVPKTTPENTVYALTLAPKTGGAPQTLFFTGGEPFQGAAPTGAHPNITMADRWHPELDPTREYCARVAVAFADGDQARGIPTSENVCATVTEIDATGTGPGAGGAPASDASAADEPPAGEGGCSTSGRSPEHAAAAVLLLGALAALGARRRRAG